MEVKTKSPLRIYTSIPYEEKDEIKAKGLKIAFYKRWYVSENDIKDNPMDYGI
jgi:hypothetical protein